MPLPVKQAGFVKHPLDRAVEQHSMIKLANLTIKPEMNSSDRRRLKLGQRFSQGLSVRHIDRKSTRLNSSHANISYAVFCLKKKTPRSSRSPRRRTHQAGPR